MNKRILQVACIGLLIVPHVALAWGAKGHQTVALIAEKEIKSDSVKQKIADLLNADDPATGMQKAATWADEIRFGDPATKPWHFTDIEISNDGYNAARDCANDDCSVAQIDKDVATLKDTSNPPAERSKALKFLIHFVGDLHQPLHSSDNNDRGGNEDPITTIDGCKEFHAVWDTAMVDYVMTDLQLATLSKSKNKAADISRHDSSLMAAKLDKQITDAERAEWNKPPSTPGQSRTVDWVNETFEVSKASIYPAVTGTAKGETTTLPDDYREKNVLIAEQQMERAAVRLAWLLEDALK